MQQQRRPGTVAVLQWQPQPGMALPDPLLADDREVFPAQVVRGVLAWLESKRPEFEKDFAPTPIVLTLSRPVESRLGPVTPVKIDTQYGVGTPEKQSMGATFSQFQTCTVEICLKNKKHAPVEASYHYLAAREQGTNRVIDLDRPPHVARKHIEAPYIARVN